VVVIESEPDLPNACAEVCLQLTQNIGRKVECPENRVRKPSNPDELNGFAIVGKPDFVTSNKIGFL